MFLSIPNRWFILVIFVALLLRIYNISSESLWVDELQLLNVARLSPGSLIEASTKDTHPPLYSLFIHYWIKIAGDTEFALRFPSVLFSMGSIFILYLIAKNISDHKTALYAVVLTAISYFQVHYAQEARNYALALFLGLVTIYLMVLLINRWHFISAIAYVISAVLLLYTHFLGLFVLFAQQIFIAYTWYIKELKNEHMIRFIFLHLSIILLFLPWIRFLILRALDVHHEFWVPAPDLLTLPKTLLVYSGTYTVFGILSFFLMLVVIFYIFIFTKQDHNKSTIVFLGIFFCIPIMAPLFVSLLWSPIYIIRVTIVSSVFYYLFVGLTLRLIRLSSVRNGIFALLIICSCANLYIYYAEINKENWREAADFIEKKAEPGSLLLFHAPFGQNGFIYYADRFDLKIESVPRHGFDVLESDLDDLQSLIRFHKQIWLILSHGRDSEKLVNFMQSQLEQKDMREFISHGINSHKPFTGIAVYKFSQEL